MTKLRVGDYVTINSEGYCGPAYVQELHVRGAYVSIEKCALTYKDCFFALTRAIGPAQALPETGTIIVSCTHPTSPRWQLDKVRFSVQERGEHGRDYRIGGDAANGYYASAPEFGCGKTRQTIEAAITQLLCDNAATITFFEDTGPYAGEACECCEATGVPLRDGVCALCEHPDDTEWHNYDPGEEY